MVQRLSEACKAHQADRELSSADSNILELDAVVRRRQAVRAFRALDLLHCQRPPAFTRDPSAGLPRTHQDGTKKKRSLTAQLERAFDFF